ncbi:HD domain-containing protein [Listeria rustica]|uniref:HD domain-containing protein n=1 Tax=Listeria rustica TaxID=2713503 RepID=A0A7W1T884_9LIST|nr:HD domain-containing protein [Listeria rustica]MBA3927252.1 HD domain-containing protein [Listeria rustica]
MNGKDILHGEYEWHDIMQDLITTKAMQRLQGVHQAGAAYLIHENWTVTRLEHSIGVMLLVQRFGGIIEEQIAGLLHDISHTSFSHVIDYLVDDKAESYHDQIFLDTIQNSEVANILTAANYNLSLEDLGQYPLLEQPAPNLCADRIDYFLRDMRTYGYISEREVTDFFDDLSVVDGQFVLQSETIAMWYIQKYQEYVALVLLDPKNIYSAWKMTMILRYTLESGYITLKFLEISTDKVVMEKLRGIPDEKLQGMLATLYTDVEVVLDKQNYDFYMRGKTRVVDPLVRTITGVVPISTINEEAKSSIKNLTEKYENGSFIRVIHV